MPEPIHRLTFAQFSQLVGAPLSRAIVEVHVHHTRRPRHQDFRGAATLTAMRRYHMETGGWGDIAQHLTIDPAGGLWTGRNWNAPPASASGANGTADAGPFMIELVGDFDEGQDRLDGPQRAAAVAVIAHVLRRFELEASAIKFHRDLGGPGSCPGSGIDRDDLAGAVTTAMAALPAADVWDQQPRGRRAPFPPEHRTAFHVTRNPAPVDQPPHAEVPEHAAAGAEIERLSRAATTARQSARRSAPAMFSRDGGCGNPEWSALKPHAVNLSRGELSEGGQFCTSPEDLDAVIDGIRTYAQSTASPRLMLYAHGGLIGETDALGHARTLLPWWRAHSVYPVFFIWESGFLEILRQYVVGPRAAAARDFADYTTDPAIEMLTKIPGTIAWNGMKESARRASAGDAGGGYPGGALLFARKLAALLSAAPGQGLTVHAVGHSAGAIFLAHLIPRLHQLGVPLASLALLAPAARTDLFKEKLLPLVGRGIERLAVFTMEEDAERQDDCFGAYRKSLLYLVSRAFEGAAVRKPIVGLEESIRRDAALKALFGLNGGAARAELQLSYAPGHDPNPLTQALRHGDFDNDPKTMAAVLRRILDVSDDTGIGEDDFPFHLAPRTLADFAPPAVAAASPGMAHLDNSPGDQESLVGTSPGARGRALCVGIDKYNQRPLAGCVNDARAWGSVLSGLGYDVTYLLDGAATRAAMLRELEALVASATPEAPVVFQFAGHGTQLPDDDGDEVDAYDEAFVPIDYDKGRLLLDDDIADVLGGLRDGASIALFMDCCHSGTNSRFAPLRRARSTADERVRYLPMSEAVVEAHRTFRRGARVKSAAAAEESLPGVVHFAACLDNEYAWETAGQGDFTRVATRLLAAAVAAGDTNEAFMAAVQRGVAASRRQHPQLMRLPDGLAGRPLLSVPPAEPA